MTCRYDRILRVSAKTKTIEACCRPLDEAVMRGQFYVSQKGQLMLRRTDKPTAGQACIACPFCGARANDPRIGDAPAFDSPAWDAMTEQAVRGEGPLAPPTSEEGGQ